MAGESLIYSQGQTATLTAQFVTSPAGVPIDISDAMVAIYDGPDTILAPVAMLPTVAVTGLYYYDWVIPNTLPVKSYTIRYTGTVQGDSTAAIDSISVVPAGTNTGASPSQKVVELIAALEVYVECAQHIPVYNELARRNRDRTIFSLTYPKWNLGNHAVFLNRELISDGFAINAESGTITFEAPLHDTDVVMASYNFRMFSQTDMIRFLADAISQINVQPPGTAYTLEGFPDQFVGILMMGATKNAIKRMLMCLNFQETAAIFGGREAAQDVMSNLNALKENNEKEFTEEKKNLKLARYPGIAAIVEPAYTLPGGRARWFRYLYSSSM